MLSEALDETQKRHKINNLLTKWRRGGWIVNVGSDKGSRWMAAEKVAEKKEKNAEKKKKGAGKFR
jgi:hypothetical protein